MECATLDQYSRFKYPDQTWHKKDAGLIECAPLDQYSRFKYPDQTWRKKDARLIWVNGSHLLVLFCDT